jgi:squalene-associated FAD-dependent desaturase
MAQGTVAVVGAGLAGLAATSELSKSGWRVEIFERSRLLGGKATSFVVDGQEIDNGQHIFLGCCSEWLDFVADLGLQDQLYLQPRLEVLLLKKGARPRRLGAGSFPAPLHLLPILLRYPSLGPAQKWSLAMAMLKARRIGDPGCSFAEWLDRHRQNEKTRRYFWNPFFIPALNAPLEEVSAEAGLFVLTTAFLDSPSNGRIGYARVPLAHIAAAAAARASEVHLRTSVTGLVATGGDIHGVLLEDGRSMAFDAVVLAVPPAALRRILGAPQTLGIAGLDRLRTRAIVDVHLWYDAFDFPFDFAAVLDSPVQWVFRKNAGYVCCSLSSADTLARWGERELVHLCQTELAAALPELRKARLRRGIATRDREATIVPEAGVRRPGAATDVPNLAIAGAWTDTGWPATMESAVRSGRVAARLVATSEVRHAA